MVVLPVGILTLALTVSPPSSLSNARCLGGTRCADGRVVTPGLLWRSATPANVSQADAAALSGARTIIDLRSQHDAEKDAGTRRLTFDEKTLTLHAPILSEKAMRRALMKRAQARPRLFAQLIGLGLGKKLSPSRRMRAFFARRSDQRSAILLGDVCLADVYMLILDDHAPLLRHAVELCARELQRGSPLLIHCTHGKDRTGVLIAVLLHSCGVSEEEILLDYALSHDWGCSVDGEWAMIKALPETVRPHVDPQTLHEWCSAPEEQLYQTFRRVEEQYGSMPTYLDSIGIPASMRNDLREQLTQAV